MFRRRAFIPLAVAAGLLAAVAPPAQATSSLVQRKSVSLPGGRSGGVLRFADRTPGQVSNSVTISADDVDGPGGGCTETWIDYSTKPHLHFNPGVLVNCSGGNSSVAGVLDNKATNVSGMGIVVCEVPNTSGRITRNSSNCQGNLSAVWLHSGQSYAAFGVHAAQFPSGVQIFRI